jgi:AraC-like DNA-binding protein
MGRRKWSAGAGQWLVSPHGSTVQSFSPDARILSIHFRCEWPTGENLFEENDALIFNAEDFPILERSGSRLERLVNRHFPGVRVEYLQQETNYPVFLKVQQRFLQWLIDFFEVMTEQKRTLSRGGSGDERLWRAAEYLHTAPLDGPFPSDQLQRETSLGRAQLDRLFWKEFGTTTREYWDKLRQESAIASLESSSMSIKEIAYHLGFKQPSHFTKWFSRRVGITPQQCRANAADEPQYARTNRK